MKQIKIKSPSSVLEQVEAVINNFLKDIHFDIANSFYQLADMESDRFVSTVGICTNSEWIERRICRTLQKLISDTVPFRDIDVQFNCDLIETYITPTTLARVWDAFDCPLPLSGKGDYPIEGSRGEYISYTERWKLSDNDRLNQYRKTRRLLARWIGDQYRRNRLIVSVYELRIRGRDVYGQCNVLLKVGVDTHHIKYDSEVNDV